jgi:alkylhydroperoxidase family enzyme
MLDAWRESGLFSEREQAALAWTESLTLLATSRAPDEVYAMVKAQFSDEESIKLTMMINVINSFNRLGVGYRLAPMQPAAARAAARAAAQ